MQVNIRCKMSVNFLMLCSVVERLAQKSVLKYSRWSNLCQCSKLKEKRLKTTLRLVWYVSLSFQNLVNISGETLSSDLSCLTVFRKSTWNGSWRGRAAMPSHDTTEALGFDPRLRFVCAPMSLARTRRSPSPQLPTWKRSCVVVMRRYWVSSLHVTDCENYLILYSMHTQWYPVFALKLYCGDFVNQNKLWLIND